MRISDEGIAFLRFLWAIVMELSHLNAKVLSQPSVLRSG